MRAGWLVALALTPLIAACGAAAGRPQAGASTAPTPTATATPSPPASTPTATPAPTPIPLPPLAIMYGDTGISAVDNSISAVDSSGQRQWTVTGAAMTTMVSAGATDRILPRIAGPNLILLRAPSGTQRVGRLAVLDRTGRVLGTGSFTPLPFNDDVFGAPTGTQWAWSVDDTPTSASPDLSQRHHGRILVAGLGIASHTVFSWVAPAGSYYDQVAAWTDMGIVIERLAGGGCGAGFHQDDASFLLDPATGTLTALFAAGQHYGDARHNVRAAFAKDSQSAVLVNGVTFDEPSSVANDLYVSPAGTFVGVQRYSVGGCGGTPTLSTELIDVATGTHVDIAGCGITGWFDAGRFVCGPYGDPTQRLEGTDGHRGPTLGTGTFVGALSSG